MFSKSELQQGLTTKVFGKNIYTYDSIDSTNTYAQTLADRGAKEGTVVIADHQTAGRGRLGRSWHDESGSSLLFSIIIRPKFNAEKIGLLPFFAAVGAAHTLEEISDKRCECKWPNDVLLNEKKCCGILMESSLQRDKLDYIVIGIGINVNQKNFQGALNGKATSLRLECGKEFDRKDIFCRMLSSLESFYFDVRKGNFKNVLLEWKTRAAIFGKRIILTHGADILDGIAVALSDDGGLIVDTNTSRRVFYAGDVTLANQP